jgi:hypothetical protein
MKTGRNGKCLKKTSKEELRTKLKIVFMGD